jgi:hypothetical protein
MPLTPSFSAPGLPLPDEANLSGNTLTLRAKAIPDVESDVDYMWEYKLADNDEYDDAANFGIVEGSKFVRSEANARQLSDIYYIRKAGDTDAFEPYIGDIKAKEEDGKMLSVTADENE